MFAELVHWPLLCIIFTEQWKIIFSGIQVLLLRELIVTGDSVEHITIKIMKRGNSVPRLTFFLEVQASLFEAKVSL